jgi:hypothetical protein|tara:strand:+ start:336 stop:713 length:378 start_codon:yes stop_codon:yes gene_type:complete
MRKIVILFFLLVYHANAFAGGHITKADKEEAIKCLGHYTAITFIPANEVEAIQIEYALASFKIAKAYLLNEKVKEDEINKGTIEELDKLIGKPLNTARNDECNSFIYKLIPGSKADIEKLRGTLK